MWHHYSYCIFSCICTNNQAIASSEIITWYYFILYYLSNFHSHFLAKLLIKIKTFFWVIVIILLSILLCVCCILLLYVCTFNSYIFSYILHYCHRKHHLILLLYITPVTYERYYKYCLKTYCAISLEMYFNEASHTTKITFILA